MKTERNEQLIVKRQNSNLSQEQAAKEIGISLRNYKYIEAGERKPNVETAISIAKFFKCEVLDLFDTPRRQPGDTETQPDYSNSDSGGIEKMKKLDRSRRNFDHRDIGVVVDVLRDGRLDDPESRESALKARDALNAVLDGAA